MGCVSSKHVKKELLREKTILHSGNGNGHALHSPPLNHIVSLTSSTYGALKLDSSLHLILPPDQHPKGTDMENQIIALLPPHPDPEPESQSPEVINAEELMEGLEEGAPPQAPSKKSSPKSRRFGLADFDARSPLKFMNQIGSPRKAKTFGGKENKFRRSSSSDFNFSPRPFLKPNNGNNNPPPKAAIRLSYPVKSSPKLAKTDSFGTDSSSSSSSSSSKRSFHRGALFDPDLVALYERELSAEGEQVKRIISLTPNKLAPKSKAPNDESESLLGEFEEKCPPGGENAVVLYTTTLRGIRRTYEDCNAVRSIVDSYEVQVMERDISMDSGFKEELRRLMGTQEVKVPLLFVKGRLVGGAATVTKLDEEGKLQGLLSGIQRRLAAGCRRCGGVRFVMCRECDGSCKVLDEESKKKVRCGGCNENGLIHCPVCC